MSNEEKDDLQSENEDLDEGVDEDKQDTENEDEELEEDSEKKFLDQKRRAEKAEAELKELREEAKNKEESQDESDDKPSSKSDELSARQILEMKTQGFSDDEILEAEDLAKKLGVPLGKVTENEVFMKGFEAMRKDKKVAEATPSPSKRGFTYNKKSWEEIARDKDMSKAEKQKAWEKMVKEEGFSSE